MNRDNAGSRLGETPLAWASCLLAQNYRAGRLGDLGKKKAWVSLRQTRLGESDSPERDYQVSPWIHLQQIPFFQTLPSCKISHAPRIAFYPYKHPVGSTRSKATQKQIKDNSNSKP